MKTRTNAQRASDARAFCAAYEIVKDPGEPGDALTGLVDLMTDARHAGIDVDAAYLRSLLHYEAETE